MWNFEDRHMHSLIMWFIVSPFWPHILQSGDSNDLSMLNFLSACSWAAKISVSPPFLVHSQVLTLSTVSGTSHKNWPCIFFSAHLFKVAFCLSCLNSFFSCAPSLFKIFVFLTLSINLSLELLTYHAKLFSSAFTHILQLINPLPPFCRGRYNRSTSLLGCNAHAMSTFFWPYYYYYYYYFFNLITIKLYS